MVNTKAQTARHVAQDNSSYVNRQADEKLSHEILDAFIESGGNFIDTADLYQKGLSEEIVGTWIKKQPRR